MRQTFALFVYGFTEEHDRAVHVVHFRDGQIVGQQVDNGSNQIVWVGRTAGDVHCVDAQVLEGVVDSLGIGRIRFGSLYAAIGGAGAVRNDCDGLGQDFGVDFEHGASTDHAVDAVVLRRDGAFNDTQEPVGGIYGLMQCFFCFVASGGHDGFVVVEADRVENQIVDKGANRTQNGF